jgi:citrate lyase beta subunit
LSGAHDEGRGGEGRPGPSGHLERGGKALWRSLLFVPGTRPDRYAKALASGADLVCVDLEDAVGPGDKASAREHVARILGSAEWNGARSAVRMNATASEEGRRDLGMLTRMAGVSARDAGRTSPTLLLPKVDDAHVVEDVGARLAEVGVEARIIAMIETARGVEHAPAIACAPRVAALFLGAVDLAAELGCTLEWEALLYARSRVVHACAIGGVPAIDVPFLDLHDRAGLEAEVRAVARLGFMGKAAIHPEQVGTIHEALAPTAAEIDTARRILDAYERSGEGVSVLEGRMIDRPVVEAARRTLAKERQPTDER